MALLEAVRPFKYMGRRLAPGDPVVPDPESATLTRQLVDQRFARYVEDGTGGQAPEGARPARSGRGRRSTPKTTTVPAPPADPA